MRRIKAALQTLRELSFKLKILWQMVSDDYDHWQENVLHSDLDEPNCCGDVAGRLCGCGAITNREVFRRRYLHQETEPITLEFK